MATLAYLTAAGTLVRHDADLEADELPVRFVYLAPEVAVWIATALRIATRDRSRNLTPYEQVEQLLYEFAVGRPMTYHYHFHTLDPIGYFVWELRTTDVRLIGWFPRKATFVVTSGCLKSELQQRRSYTPHVQKAVAFRNALDLDPPKAITGVSHHDVL